MGSTCANHSGQASDTFSSYMNREYAVVKIKNGNTTPAITIFTPSGLNCAVDYLREFRAAIDSAIAELVEAGAIEEEAE